LSECALLFNAEIEPVLLLAVDVVGVGRIEATGDSAEAIDGDCVATEACLPLCPLLRRT
jgi:hypothetical protein